MTEPLIASIKHERSNGWWWCGLICNHMVWGEGERGVLERESVQSGVGVREKGCEGEREIMIDLWCTTNF